MEKKYTWTVLGLPLSRHITLFGPEASGHLDERRKGVSGPEKMFPDLVKCKCDLYMTTHKNDRKP